jgi:hypothetical protein
VRLSNRAHQEAGRKARLSILESLEPRMKANPEGRKRQCTPVNATGTPECPQRTDTATPSFEYLPAVILSEAKNLDEEKRR